MTSVVNVRPTIDPADLDPSSMTSKHLRAVLADSYVLMARTHGVHWNVTGPLFVSVHDLTEIQYKDLFSAVDDIAERIRAIGHPAPSDIATMAAESEISGDVDHMTAEEMVKALCRDHETVARRIKSGIDACEHAHDVASADLLTQRLRFHEKAIWMLASINAA